MSIGDFGTECSSLVRVQRFSINYLKINRSFVSGMTDRPVDAAIVDALLGIVRSLGIRAVAKGVEPEGQLAVLRAAGCELGQGFLWSEPLPAAEATRVVEEARRSRSERLRRSPQGSSVGRA
jgi:EAL domain-containing protein (putative c-di-GMP-specific phosphodiesterase class I)